MDFRLGETILYTGKVSAGYDGKEVIKDVEILEKDVLRDGYVTGQTIAVIGRSGRGKSTLFKVLTGLNKPMSGQVLIADDHGEAQVAKAGDVGFVDQKYTLFRHKTIYQTFKFALRNADMTKDEKEQLIEEYLQTWWLSQQRDQYPNELSGGQKQRVAIIEQLLSSKRFIVMDEPFSGLDRGNIKRLKEYFDKVLAMDELNTIIFSTHDLGLAVDFADSIYILGYTPDKLRVNELREEQAKLIKELTPKWYEIWKSSGKKRASYTTEWAEIERELNAIHEKGFIDAATIVKHYDLKELGLAWGGSKLDKLALAEQIEEVLLQS